MSPCPCAPRYSLLALLTCALEVLVRVPVFASVIMSVRARAMVVRVRGGRGARGGEVVDELDVHYGSWEQDEGRRDGGIVDSGRLSYRRGQLSSRSRVRDLAQGQLEVEILVEIHRTLPLSTHR